MDQVSQIREKIDIVAFISEYIPLKKAGRNFKANCPFHNEKTPSFIISPERQIWHCFGCGKGGDAFTFLMDYENMEFPEALRILARKTGIVLKETSFQASQYSEKEKIFSLNNLALKYYHYILLNHPSAKNALDYLTSQRKINKGIIETFEIGFAPSSGSGLSDYLMQKKGFKKKDLLDAGLAFEARGRVFDFFRGRIMFPLFDHRGNVTGFSGRTLDEKANPPKYINTKETTVYHKGSMFFGLNSTKEEIKNVQNAIVVEGEFDAISLFMEGIKNVVAIKGTALTEDQVALLARFTPKVSLCLDRDVAGFEATKRSLAVLEKRGLTTTIVLTNNGKDPDEAIKNNPLEFKKAVKNDIGIYDFLVSKFLEENDKNTIEGKKKITDNLLLLFAQISNEVVKEHYLKKLSKEIDVSLESLTKEIEKIQKGTEEEKIIVSERQKRTRKELLEEYLISLLVQEENSKEILEKIEKGLDKYKFEALVFEKILEKIKVFLTSHEKMDGKKFSSALPKELLPVFDACSLFPLPKFTSQEKLLEEVDRVIDSLNSLDIKERIKEETVKLKENLNTKETETIEKEIKELLSLLPKSIN
jgi:DNA primase